MSFWNSLLIGLREIWAHKFRSFLTMLGIILGGASLLATFALVAGMAAGSREFMQQYGGVEKVDVLKQPAPEEQEAMEEVSPGITVADAVAIRDGVPGVSYVTPVYDLDPIRASRAGETSRSEIDGVWPDYVEINKHVIELGRNLTQLDIENASHVCVVGRTIVEELWPDRKNYNPLGETVDLGGRPYTIVGVFEFYEREEDKRRRELGLKKVAQFSSRSGRSQGMDPFYRKNRSVIIPFTTAFHDFRSYQITGPKNEDQGPVHALSSLVFQIADLDRFEETLDEVTEALKLTHRGIEDFGFNTRQDYLERIEESSEKMRLVGGLIAGVSLIVGGIGIMNIMLASITERIREIGVRRAVGAKGRHIFAQIIVESAVIGIIGGAVGLPASQGMIAIIQAVNPAEFAPVIELEKALASFGAAVLIGILSGIYPAWKASKVAPIEALRYG